MRADVRSRARSISRRLTLLSLVLSVLCPGTTRAAETDPADPATNALLVRPLVFNDFFSTLDAHDGALVLFYAPWCPKSRKMYPSFSRAAAQLRLSHPSVVLAKVDAVKEKMLAQAMDVNQYPSLFWFHPGKTYDAEFKSAETANADSIVSFVSAKYGASENALRTPSSPPAPAAPATTWGSNDVNSDDGDSNKDPVESTATNDSAATTTASLSSSSSDSSSSDGLPPVLSFPSLQLLQIIKRDISIPKSARQLLLVYSSDDPLERALTTGFERMARLHADDPVVCIAVDAKDTRALRHLKISRAALPVLVGIDFLSSATGSEERYVMHKPRAVVSTARQTLKELKGLGRSSANSARGKETLEAAGQALWEQHWGPEIALFATGQMARAPDYEAPPIPQWTALKSAPMLEEEEAGRGTTKGSIRNNIVEVSGDSFKAEVVDVSTDVLVLVYAPWCAHCKSFEPVFSRVAGAVGSAVSTLKVCRMDGDKNDVHGLKITSFPTLFVFPALDKSERGVVAYGGEAGWTAPAVLDWVAKSTTFAFDPTAVARIAAGLQADTEGGGANGGGGRSSSGAGSKDEL